MMCQSRGEVARRNAKKTRLDETKEMVFTLAQLAPGSTCMNEVLFRTLDLYPMHDL